MAVNGLEAARKHPENQGPTKKSAPKAPGEKKCQSHQSVSSGNITRGWYPTSDTGVPIPEDEVRKYEEVKRKAVKIAKGDGKKYRKIKNENDKLSKTKYFRIRNIKQII